MSKISYVAAAALLATAPSAHAIQNGKVDADNHYSNVGGVVVVQPLVNLPPWDQIPVPWIGGSGVLIHPRVMLTAGHTVEELELGAAAGNSIDVVRASFGPDAYDPATWLQIDSFLKHPKSRSFNGAAEHVYDIGVLILKEPVLGVTPAQLPDPFLLDSLRANGNLGHGASRAPFTVVGYGLQDDNAIRADGLRYTTTLHFRSLRPTWIDFFGPQQGLSDVAQGDSGGPIFWTDLDTGAEHLVATVTGWNKLETHTRVDLPEVLEFLNEVIALIDGTPTSAAALSYGAVPEPTSTILLGCLGLPIFITLGRHARRLGGYQRMMCGTGSVGALALAWVPFAASPLRAAYPTSVIFSTVASSTTSDVPGHPGKKFRFQGLVSLVSPSASPDGARWAISGLVTEPDPIDSQWLVVGNGPSAASAQVMLIPGVTPVPGEPAQVFTHINAPWMPISNGGQFAFAAQTSASQDIVARFNGSDFELIAQPGANSPLSGVPYGDFHTDAHDLANGQVTFVSTNDAVGEQVMYGNSDVSNGNVVARTGVTIPAGQLTTPEQSLGFIRWHKVRTDATGTHQIYDALLEGPTATSAVVVMDGQVVAQRGHPVPGFSNTAPLLNVHFVNVSSFNGLWLFAGSVNDGTNADNATDFVSFNGNVIASTGSPIYTGSAETWHDAGTTNTFYWANVNRHGDYAIAGLTNTGAQALVLNGSEVLLRAGDPIDLDGNGLFDDGATVAFLSTSLPGTGAVLADNGSLYLTAMLTVQGQLSQASMVIQLPTTVPEPSSLTVAACAVAVLYDARRRRAQLNR